jgi:hypothetical protein
MKILTFTTGRLIVRPFTPAATEATEYFGMACYRYLISRPT